MKIKGFTLIEVVVTVSIIALLATFTAISFNSARTPKKALENSGSEIMSVLNKAVDYAHSGYNCCTGDEYGFGIYFDGADYHFFADLDGDYEYIATNDEIIETSSFSGDIEISSIQYEQPQGSFINNANTITFPSPSGTAYFEGVETQGRIRITLSHPEEAISAYIYISGLTGRAWYEEI